jgi:hypothetical protein
MAKGSNIVHQYFKKELSYATILVRVNPILFNGTEITVLPDGKSELREMEFDEHILEDLKTDGFESGNAMQFNLYLSGLL